MPENQRKYISVADQSLARWCIARCREMTSKIDKDIEDIIRLPGLFEYTLSGFEGEAYTIYQLLDYVDNIIETKSTSLSPEEIGTILANILPLAKKLCEYVGDRTTFCNTGNLALDAKVIDVAYLIKRDIVPLLEKYNQKTM